MRLLSSTYAASWPRSKARACFSMSSWVSQALKWVCSKASKTPHASRFAKCSGGVGKSLVAPESGITSFL
eukprot:6456946-Alexandrium_andersonii.AAC.1